MSLIVWWHRSKWTANITENEVFMRENQVGLSLVPETDVQCREREESYFTFACFEKKLFVNEVWKRESKVKWSIFDMNQWKRWNSLSNTGNIVTGNIVSVPTWNRTFECWGGLCEKVVEPMRTFRFSVELQIYPLSRLRSWVAVFIFQVPELLLFFPFF